MSVFNESQIDEGQTGDEPRFPTLDHEIDGVVANTRISFALTTVSRTASRGEWSRAIDALASLAEKLGAWDPPTSAWQELLSAAAWYAVRASKIELVTALFEAYADRAWSTNARQTMPFGLADALELADRRGRFDAGRDLSVLIEALFPSCPLGTYGAAHFSERKLHMHGSSEDASRIAETFAKAAQLADTLEMYDTKRRALLRSGALLLRSGGAREEGRRLLRDIEPTELSRADSLWYAVGMAHSPFWLDRVRATDAVIAAVEADAREASARHDEQPPRADVLQAAEYMLDCAPIELQPLEVDRFEGLAEELEVTTHKLRLRSHLQGIASAPAERAGEAADIIAQSIADQSLSNETTDEQRAAVAFCRAVADLLDDQAHDGLDHAALERIEKFYPTAARVLEALEPTVAEDARKLATALGELEGHFRRYGHRLTREALKPIALLWPKLLPFLRTLDADEDIDQTTKRRVVASADDIATRWLKGAPTPGYGWWSLAANLLASGMNAQSAEAARRAIDDGESVDGELERRVIAAVLDWAIRDGSQEQMVEWLEVAEERLR